MPSANRATIGQGASMSPLVATSATARPARASGRPMSISLAPRHISTVHPFVPGFLSNSDETQIASSADDGAAAAP